MCLHLTLFLAQVNQLPCCHLLDIHESIANAMQQQMHEVARHNCQAVCECFIKGASLKVNVTSGKAAC